MSNQKKDLSCEINLKFYNHELMSAQTSEISRIFLSAKKGPGNFCYLFCIFLQVQKGLGNLCYLPCARREFLFDFDLVISISILHNFDKLSSFSHSRRCVRLWNRLNCLFFILNRWTIQIADHTHADHELILRQ